MNLQSKTVTDLPKFSTINPKNIEKDLTQLLDKNRKKIRQLLEENIAFTWDNLLRPLENIQDELHHYWSPVSHLHSVATSDILRKAYGACVPKLSEYSTELGHNEKLFRAIQSIADSKDYQKLNPAQKKVVADHLRDFRLAGIGLPEKQKKQFTELSKQLAELATKFEENILDATQGWVKHITDEKQLAGMPKSVVESAAEAALHRGLEGWVFTLEAPSYIGVMKYADSAELRKEMYFAYTTRASDQGPNAGQWLNSKVMTDILQKRAELAKLLGFESYAEYSLSTKMVKKPEQVLAFLNELAEASYKGAEADFKYLSDFAKKQFQIEKLNAWDLAYYGEKLRQHDYDVSQEQIRPYFPEYKVLSGLFAIVKKLFNIEIHPVSSVDVWHPEVRCFSVHNVDGSLRAHFYLDLYARENKRSGAWMDDARMRRRLDNGAIQLPAAYITCNFNRPLKDQPALFTHEEVITLFHEFGHSLQHMLTTVEYSEVSGINGIPWDAVEVASQFLENWVWESEPVQLLAEHYQTKKSLPEELFKKMHKAKNFQSAMQMMRQLEFSLFDFRLHMEFDPNIENQVQKILDEVRQKVAVYKVPEFNRFQHSFSHIFAGGYAAGYYSYKWAEVMAADAFSLFEEKGIFDPETSQKFLSTFLQSGGVPDPLDLFIQFRGRKPDIQALLKQSGIVA